jgi:hypothetical protein
MGERHIIKDTTKFPIQPDHIDASGHLYDSFGHMETEISAGWIIRFLQERGQSWAPFTFEEIDAFYSRKLKGGFRFNRLINPEMIPPNLARAFAGHNDPLIPAGGWIVKGDDEKYYVTDEFVTFCFKSSPAKQK